MYLIIMIITHDDDSDVTDDMIMIKTIHSSYNVTDLKYVSLKIYNVAHKITKIKGHTQSTNV